MLNCAVFVRVVSCLQMYYRGAACAIVCFDITHEESFTKMKDWVEELKQNVSDLFIIYLLLCFFTL